MTFKHKLSRRLALLKDVAVLAVLAAAACQTDRGIGGPTLEGDATRLIILPHHLTVGTGRSATFIAVALDATGDTLTGPIVWSVSGGGELTDSTSNNGGHRGQYRAGDAPGHVKVIGRRPREGVADTADVTVSPVGVASVTVSPGTVDVLVGEWARLTATTFDSAGNVLVDRGITWSSSRTAVATVDENGIVTGVGAGTAVVTATSEEVSASATVTVAVPPPPTHTGYYVAPGGSAAGTGTVDRPWDLATALAGAGGRILPGDTVWVRGGIYRGWFETALTGTASARITFRQVPGERATIDGSLRAEGAYLTFWGFEILQSNPLGSTEYVLRAYTRGGQFVNLVLHDAGVSGVSFAKDNGEGVELYGSLVYNNGTHENNDHGIYGHNATTGPKFITDNVFFNNYARGIQLYADEDAALRDITVAGNVAFNNGTISSSSTRVNLLISATVPTSAMVARDNLLYHSPGVDGIQLRLGNYGAAYNGSIAVRGTYAAGGSVGLQMRYAWTQATVEDNTFVGAAEVVQTGGAGVATSYRWNGNVYHRDPTAAAWEHESAGYDFAGWRAVSGLGASDVAQGATPTSPHVVVRPNRFEPGRAHVVIYNWGRQASVAVDLSGVLHGGDRFEIRNVQDFYGPPVVRGTYEGGAVSVPMTGVAPPTPLGRTAPNRAPRTGPDFDVFVVVTIPG